MGSEIPGAPGADPASADDLASPSTPAADGGSPSTDLDLDDAIADIDADIAGQARPTTEEDPTAPKGTRSAFQRFADKNYGGDEDAAIAGIYETRTSMARLTSDFEALKQRIDERPSGPTAADREEALKEAVSTSPDVTALDQDILSIDNEIKSLNASQSELLRRAGTVQSSLQQAEAEYNATDDVGKPALLRKIMRFEREIQALDTEFRDNEQALRQLPRNRAQVLRERSAAIRSIKQSMEEHERATRNHTTYVRTTNEDFDQGYMAAAASYGLQPDSKQFIALYDGVKNELANRLIAMGGEADEVDMARAVATTFRKYADAFGLQPRGSRRSLPSPAVPVRVPRSAPAGSSNGGDNRNYRPASSAQPDLTPAQIRQRADRIDQVISRRRA